MRKAKISPFYLVVFGFVGFLLLVLYREELPSSEQRLPGHDRVVISAPVLTVLHAGDHYLAANLETIRLSATAIDHGMVDDFYLLRAHDVVSQLNPCHENNYYLANALLTWGGAVDEGGSVLQRAAACRQWDELPPFLYGFNQYFFNRNIPEAQRALRVAAQRAGPNREGYLILAVMIEVDQIEDEKIALAILREERDAADNPRLAEMLGRRVQRIEGLATLRDAHRAYEQDTGHTLEDPEELIRAGYLSAFPVDPMRWGYQFKDGHFQLRWVRVSGVEDR